MAGDKERRLPLMGGWAIQGLDLSRYKKKKNFGRKDILASSQVMGKTLVQIASVGSGVAVLACLFTVGYIFNDINSFYDDVIDTMTEFKVRSVFTESLRSPEILSKCALADRLIPYSWKSSRLEAARCTDQMRSIGQVSESRRRLESLTVCVS